MRLSFKTFALVLCTFILCACAGTVKRDTNYNASVLAGAKFSTVQINLTDAAKKLQLDNSQFNATDLRLYVERKLDAASMVNANSPYQISITIESFRVRSAIAAVMFGIMAGTDSINGRVYVTQNGRSVHSFVVDASYGLGGMMGGDSTRMNWLYDKFAELTVKELAGETDKQALVRKTASDPVAPPPMVVASPSQAATVAAPAVPVVTTPRALPEASGFADVYDVAKLPASSEACKKLYAEWLGKANPKAFAISGSGRCFYSWSTNPADKTLPLDPNARTLINCNRTTNAANDCKLYAVDGVVIWKP